jgi:hypothetical protein
VHVAPPSRAAAAAAPAHAGAGIAGQAATAGLDIFPKGWVKGVCCAVCVCVHVCTTTLCDSSGAGCGRPPGGGPALGVHLDAQS